MDFWYSTRDMLNHPKNLYSQALYYRSTYYPSPIRLRILELFQNNGRKFHLQGGRKAPPVAHLDPFGQAYH